MNRPSRVQMKQFFALFGLGLTGIVAMAVLFLVMPDQLPAEALEAYSLPVVVLLQVGQVTGLLAAAVVLGMFAAPRVGLRSYVYEYVKDGSPVLSRLRGDLRPAVGLGVATGAVLGVWQIWVTPEITFTAREILLSVPQRFLFGGVTEELLMRWGFMSAVVYGLFRGSQWFRDGETDAPSARMMWAGILVAALLFGVGHLPAAAATYDMTLFLAAGIVAGNALGGIVFGYLYWRHSLEAAMVAHAAAHVPLTLALVLAVL